MTGGMSIGKRLVRSFQLLLDYRPNEECEALINERMLSLPDKTTFQGVMMYILQFLDEQWCSKACAVIVTKQDERAFYNALCNHLKLLRKQFPEVCVPLITPSSLYCFHGEKCRETLLKICEALMLHIIKKETSDIGTEDSKITLLEIQTIKEDCNSFQKQIQKIKEEVEKAVLHEKRILELIISLGNWDKNTKTRLLDLKDELIISELQKENSSRFEELVLIRKKLQPFIDRTYKGYAVQNQSSIEMLIYDLQDNANKNFIRTQIANLNLISEMQRLSVPGLQNIHENPVIDAHMVSQIIENLEILVQGNTTRDHSYAFLEDSNCCKSSQCSPGFNTSILYFTPKFDKNKMKMKSSPIEMDVQTLAKFVCPIKIDVDVIDLSTDKIRNTVISDKTKLQTNTILSVAQRLTLNATPMKFHPHIYKSFNDISSRSMCTSSGFALSLKDKGKSCLVTPCKMQLPGISRTTGRRQSMGFVKPTGYFARRHLNTNTPCLKRDVQSSEINIIPQSEKVAFDQPSVPSSKENPKAVSDERLNRIVENMVAEANLEKSSFEEESDFLNSSLDGIDFLPSSPLIYEPAPKQMLSDLSLQDTNCSILSEISDIEADISGAVCELKQIFNRAEISNENGNLLSCKEVSLQKAKCGKKTLSDSFNELIERFNAIKVRSQKSLIKSKTWGKN